jgi:hypothetical protein
MMVPTVRAIITLIVVVGVIPVGVLTIIIGLTLIVITVGRPIIRSTRIVATVGIPWSYGNGNLGFRFCRNQSEKPKEGQEQDEMLFHIITFYAYDNTQWRIFPNYSKQSGSSFSHTRKQR